MARQPRIRVNYGEDSRYLLRLIQDIEADEKKPLEWRKRVIALIQELAVEFRKP